MSCFNKIPFKQQTFTVLEAGKLKIKVWVIWFLVSPFSGYVLTRRGKRDEEGEKEERIL